LLIRCPPQRVWLLAKMRVGFLTATTQPLCVVGRSATLYRRPALPTGASTRRPVGTSPMGFVWRGLRNYCLAPLLLYCLLLMYLKSLPEGLKKYFILHHASYGFLEQHIDQP